MTATNAYGWSPRGFDPDKVRPSWKQYAIDACEFVIDDRDRMRVEAPELLVAADHWLPILQKANGFIEASAQDMVMLGGVIEDWADYEQVNGYFEEEEHGFDAGHALIARNVLFGQVSKVPVEA